MQLKKIDIDMIAHSLLTSLITAICISTIYLINSSYFSLLGILLFSFIFFCFYLVIASPLQILLNQRPKNLAFSTSRSIMFFLVLSHGLLPCFLIWKILSILPSFILCASLFWKVDSLLLQKKAE